MRLLLSQISQNVSQSNIKTWLALLYDRVLRHKQIRVNKLDMTWNWSFNTPCKSLKDILSLFEEEEQPYHRDTSKFYNPRTLFLIDDIIADDK